MSQSVKNLRNKNIAPFSGGDNLFYLWSHMVLYCVCVCVQRTKHKIHTTHNTLHTTHYTLNPTQYTIHTTHYTLHTVCRYAEKEEKKGVNAGHMRDSRDRWATQTLHCTFSLLYYRWNCFLKKGDIYWLRLKCTWVHVWVHQSELARRGELKHEFRWTWVETAWRALSRQVLRGELARLRRICL